MRLVSSRSGPGTQETSYSAHNSHHLIELWSQMAINSAEAEKLMYDSRRQVSIRDGESGRE